MPWSLGTYTRSNGSSGWQNDEAGGIGITSPLHDTQDNDLATGINNCLTKDGQNTPTANLPMGGFAHTNVAVATARTQYLTLGQFQDGTVLYGGTAGGTANALTLTITPAISSYVTGMVVRFLAASNNTTACTININGIGAATLGVTSTYLSLIADQIVGGRYYTIIYNGSSWVLTDPSIAWHTWGGSITYGAAGAMTVGTPTTLESKYTHQAKLINFSLAFQITLGGVASNTINFSWPVLAQPKSVYERFVASYFNGGTTVMAYGAIASGSTAAISKYDGSNFALGAGQQVQITGCYEPNFSQY